MHHRHYIMDPLEGRNRLLIRNPANSEIPGVGSSSILLFNTQSRPFVYTANASRISSQVAMPLHIMLAHELIHADRAARGFSIPASEVMDIILEVERMMLSPWRIIGSTTRTATHTNQQLEELVTIGIIPCGDEDDCITENMIREEHGLNPRTSHSGSYR